MWTQTHVKPCFIVSVWEGPDALQQQPLPSQYPPIYLHPWETLSMTGLEPPSLVFQLRHPGKISLQVIPYQVELFFKWIQKRTQILFKKILKSISNHFIYTYYQLYFRRKLSWLYNRSPCGAYGHKWDNSSFHVSSQTHHIFCCQVWFLKLT